MDISNRFTLAAPSNRGRIRNREEEICLHSYALQLFEKIDRFSSQIENYEERHRAWEMFNSWDDPQNLDLEANRQIFLAWHLFRNRTGQAPSIAQQYIWENLQCSSLDQFIVASAIQSPLDFYEIHEFPALNRTYLKSLCLGYQGSFSFFEPPGTIGQIILGKVIPLIDDQGILLAKSPPLGREAKVSIATLRRSLIAKRREEFERDFALFESDILSTYYDAATELTKT